MTTLLEPTAPWEGTERNVVFALNEIWDVPTLAWVKDEGGGGGGGGGGAVTIADGADVAQGTKADAAWVAGDGTVISLLKKIASAGGGAVSVADGADVAQGAKADAAWVSGDGTVIALLKKIVGGLASPFQAGGSIGNTAFGVNNAAGASAVNIQDGGNSITVDGTVTVNTGLTDTQLRAVPVDVYIQDWVGGVASVVTARADLTSSAPTAATVGVASAQAVAANANRQGLVLVNTSSARISLGFGSAAVLDSGITLYPGGVFEMDEYTFDTAAVNAIASAAASNLGVQEYA